MCHPPQASYQPLHPPICHATFQDIGSFGSIHPKLRGVGMASVYASFLILAYYTVIIAYAVAVLGEAGVGTGKGTCTHEHIHPKGL